MVEPPDDTSGLVILAIVQVHGIYEAAAAQAAGDPDGGDIQMSGDSVEFHWITDDWDKMVDELTVDGGITDRATMWALRETGRAVMAAARNRAPVYSGDDPRPVRGALRSSIKSSRTITRAAGGYELHVTPTGTVTGKNRGVPLYRNKMEAKYGYMAAATAAGSAAAQAAFEEAYRIAFAR